METDRLRQFCTIFETGNLRKAAELLHITHGALSKSMKKLESDLGYKLFLPEGRGLVVTDQAKKLYRKALDTLKSVEALYSVSHTDTEALKIGSFEVFTTYFLHQLKSWLPEIELKLYELTPGKMEESVGKGLIDFGITYVPIPYEGVEFVEVGKLKMGVYKKTESFINQELGELPFVVPNFPLEGSPSGVKGLDSWPESAPDRKIKYRVDLMESALALCREGHCAVFIPDFVAKIHNQISHSDYQLDQWNPPKNIADKIKNVVRTIYIVKRKSMEETAEIRKIARWIRSLN